MSFAQGRDDESEALAKARNDAIAAQDRWLTIFMLGNQAAMQCAAGTAMSIAVQQAEVPTQPARKPKQLAD